MKKLHLPVQPLTDAEILRLIRWLEAYFRKQKQK